MLRSSENQIDGVVSRVSDSASGSVAYDLVKTRLSESQAKKEPLGGPENQHCDWFVLRLKFGQIRFT